MHDDETDALDPLDPFEGDWADMDDGRPRCRHCGLPLYGVAALEAGECDACMRIGVAMERARALPVPWFERRRA